MLIQSTTFVRWYAQDERVGLRLDDGGDSWWAGTQRNFAGVAIAGAAAALAASVAIAGTLPRDADQPAQVAATVKFEDDNWFAPRLQSATAPPLLLWANEDVVPQPVIQTSGGVPFYGQRGAVRTTFVKWHQTDEVVTAAPPSFVDEQYTLPPPTLIPPQ